MSSSRALYFTALCLVILSLLLQEVEGRRKILEGRKTITRKYSRGNAIPAWVIVVLVGSSMVIMGGILYVIMKKIFIGNPRTAYSPTAVNEI